jgi:hypothetical protein
MVWAAPVVTEHPRGTIGPGWSDDPDTRRAEMAAQERLVSEVADIMEHMEDWDFG